jgi:enoyl-CoA hydratase/carnithine racemase
VKALHSVRYERSGDVGHVILSNPPHNLLNVQFYEQLREAVGAATAQDTFWHSSRTAALAASFARTIDTDQQ